MFYCVYLDINVLSSSDVDYISIFTLPGSTGTQRFFIYFLFVLFYFVGTKMLPGSDVNSVSIFILLDSSKYILGKL